MSERSRSCPVIGIAGGIGAGKSTVTGIFEQLGAVIIDADEIAHRVLLTAAVRSEIAATFGDGVIENGTVSRPALAAVAFGDREALDSLNAIVHPGVIAESTRIIAASGKRPDCPAVVLDAPLLFEAGLDRLCDVVVFVDAAENVRLERLAAERGWDRAELVRREKFQDSLISKRQRADYSVDNNGSLEEAAERVADVYESIVGS